MPPKNQDENNTSVVPATPPVAPTNEGNNEPPAPPATPPVVPSQNAPVPPKAPVKLSKRERLEFAKGKIEEQLEELEAEDDDERPATMGDIKRLTQQANRETSISLANQIENVDERAAVIEILESRIIPSDKPEDDLKLARSMVNGVKNSQLLEEEARKKQPGNHANTPSQPGNSPQEPFEPTAQELVFMSKPYGLTKEDIISSRQKTQANAQ